MSEPAFSSFDVQALQDFVYSNLGIVIHSHQHGVLEETIKEGIDKFHFRNGTSYVNQLQNLPSSSPEIEHLIGKVTVGESFFFRDEGQMQLLKEKLLPELIDKRKRKGKTLRIWSAAASKGQELYSIGILLYELLGNDIRDWNLHLVGTDINAASLKTALNGDYSDWSFRGIDQKLQSNYFTKTAEGFQVQSKIRRLAKFEYLNLVADNYPSILHDIHSMDIILCRNVFIYFTKDIVTGILTKLVDTLVTDGVLITAPSDVIDNRVPGLVTNYDMGVSYFSKPAPKPIVTEELVNSSLPKKLDAISKAAKESRDIKQLVDLIIDLQNTESWREIRAIAEEYISIFNDDYQLTLAYAESLGQLGSYEAAIPVCEQAIKLNNTGPTGYFVKALVLMEAGNRKDAEQALKQAIFLDSGFIEAHFQLGMLMLSQGNKEKGLKSLTNARKLAKNSEAEKPLIAEKKVTVGRLVEVLDREIGLHS